jgi:hypothetical protein
MITAAVIIGLAAVLIALAKLKPMMVMLWCLPALLIGRNTDSSFGFYFGAVLQIAVGAWLVVWFHPCRTQDEKTAA